ncbi:MAG: VOC family protein [Oscillospiraceae bacterium]|nr:VOC family protein [Oscillospiraceae bacterium]
MTKYLWTTYSVFDLDETISFYRQLLGLKIVRQLQAGPNRQIVFLGTGTPGETLVELMNSDNARDLAHSATISMGFRVESLDAAMAKIDEMGLALYAGPFAPSSDTRFCFVLDPNGVKIQLVEQSK